MVSVSGFKWSRQQPVPHSRSLGRGVSAAISLAISYCTDGPAQGLAVAWSTVMIFDLIVVVMTFVRTIKINRRSGKKHTLTQVLMRDGKVISCNASGWSLSSYVGVVYFGYISFLLCKCLRRLKSGAQSH